MSSSEFARICRELYAINETVNIEADGNCVKFYVNNENIGGGFTLEAVPSDNKSIFIYLKNFLLWFNINWLN